MFWGFPTSNACESRRRRLFICLSNEAAYSLSYYTALWGQLACTLPPKGNVFKFWNKQLILSLFLSCEHSRKEGGWKHGLGVLITCQSWHIIQFIHIAPSPHLPRMLKGASWSGYAKQRLIDGRKERPCSWKYNLALHYNSISRYERIICHIWSRMAFLQTQGLLCWQHHHHLTTACKCILALQKEENNS